MGENLFIVSEALDAYSLQTITAPFIFKKEGGIHKLMPVEGSKQTFTLNKRKKKLDQRHTLHYWGMDKSRLIPLEKVSSTDTTQTYNQIPKKALLWFTVPERIVNQQVFYIENDSIKTE